MEQVDKNLIDEFDRIQNVKKDLELKEEELRNKIIALAQQRSTNLLFGTHKTCSIKEYEKVSYPENKDLLIKLLKEDQVYDHFSQINYSRLSSAITRKDVIVTTKILEQVKLHKDFKITLLDRGV